MRVGVVSLVRNEADVLPAFLSHLAALVDDAVLMDHGSIDGSAALMEAACVGRPGWAAWRVAVPGYHQVLFCGFAARHLFRAGVDQVLFLDADEFIDLPDRTALEAALARMDQPGDIGVWAWRDCVPDRLGGVLGFGDALWQAPVESRYPKVVLSRTLFAASGGRAGPAVGAHFVRDAGVATRDVPLGTVLHLPLRSAEQMRRKIVLGSLAELARSDRGATDARHWAEGLARVAAGPVDDDDVRGMAARYGEPGAAWERIGPDGLAARGFTLRTLAVAHAAVPANVPSAPVGAWQVVADALRGWEPAPSATLSLEVVDGVLRPSAGDSWRDPFLTGTPLLDLAREALAPGSRTLVIGLDPAALGAGASADTAAGPFDAAVVQDMTAVHAATAHAVLRPGGLLVAETAGATADPALAGTVADLLGAGLRRRWGCPHPGRRRSGGSASRAVPGGAAGPVARCDAAPGAGRPGRALRLGGPAGCDSRTAGGAAGPVADPAWRGAAGPHGAGGTASELAPSKRTPLLRAGFGAATQRAKDRAGRSWIAAPQALFAMTGISASQAYGRVA